MNKDSFTGRLLSEKLLDEWWSNLGERGKFNLLQILAKIGVREEELKNHDWNEWGQKE